MGDLSAHFNRDEFQCRCKACMTGDPEHSIVIILEAIRAKFCDRYGKARIIINNGNRCWKYNEIVQFEKDPDYKPGSSSSTHMYFIAADIVVERYAEPEWEQVGPDEVADVIDEMWPDSLGLGRYNDFTHVDARLVPGRWDRRTKE